MYDIGRMHPIELSLTQYLGQSLYVFLYLEDVLQAFKGHSDDAWIIDSQQLAQRLDAASCHKDTDLLCCATRGGIADCPCSLLLDVKLSSGQQVNEWAQQVGIQYCLDLLLQIARECMSAAELY
jgi:hypothetical protein